MNSAVRCTTILRIKTKRLELQEQLAEFFHFLFFGKPAHPLRLWRVGISSGIDEAVAPTIVLSLFAA